MKIIDLLNKIANGEEVPNKIKYADDEYIWTGLNYYNEKKDEYLDSHIALEDLEYPIVIIKEEKKIPEKLYGIVNSKEGTTKVPSNEELMYKINEIIDYLKSKGDE